MRPTTAVRWIFLTVLSMACATNGAHEAADATRDPIFGLLSSDPSSIEHVNELLARSGYSRLPLEAAAFLVGRDGAGLDWPDTHAFDQASYQGSLPSRCLAIVHTHPIALPQTSPADASEAHRLNVAVVAITPRTFAIVWPDGESATIRLANGWAEQRKVAVRR